MTILIGLVGAIIGGLVVSLFGGIEATDVDIWSILVATLGAIILLEHFRLVASRRVT